MVSVEVANDAESTTKLALDPLDPHEADEVISTTGRESVHCALAKFKDLALVKVTVKVLLVQDALLTNAE